jgi:hypothetical protein
MHGENFNGFAPGSVDGADDGFGERHSKGRATAMSRHLDKNFEGMALTADPNAAQPRKVAGQQHEWSKQRDTAGTFDGLGLRSRKDAGKLEPGEVNDFPSRRVDRNLPWTRQFQSGNFVGMTLTKSPDPLSPPRQESSPFDSELSRNDDPFFNITTKRRVQQPLPRDGAGGSRNSSTVRITGS